MGVACSECNGMGFGSVGPNGYEDTGTPCPSCNPNAEPKAPGSFMTPKKVATNTIEGVDGPITPAMADEQGQGPEAFFS